jgi:DNA invertase Pin-like site-specific DNA recombinase
MLDEETRGAILKLNEAGRSRREIARALDVSRTAVAGVLKSMNKKPPQVEREEKPEPFREAILELYASCKGVLSASLSRRFFSGEMTGPRAAPEGGGLRFPVDRIRA